MDLYQVFEKRRTIRDFSDKEVSDEVLNKILSAAFKAPTNDHLRQFEFIVVRGQENIARIIAPVAKNTEDIQHTYIESASDWMDKDEHAMFVDALPKQQKMLIQSNCLILPFFRQKDCPLCNPLFRIGVVCHGESPVGCNCRRIGLCVPYSHRERTAICETNRRCTGRL